MKEVFFLLSLVITGIVLTTAISTNFFREWPLFTKYETVTRDQKSCFIVKVERNIYGKIVKSQGITSLKNLTECKKAANDLNQGNLPGTINDN